MKTAGSKSIGLCDNCGHFDATYDMSPVQFLDGSGQTYNDVLVLLCDGCGDVIGIPHNSAVDINRQQKFSELGKLRKLAGVTPDVDRKKVDTVDRELVPAHWQQ